MKLWLDAQFGVSQLFLVFLQNNFFELERRNARLKISKAECSNGCAGGRCNLFEFSKFVYLIKEPHNEPFILANILRGRKIWLLSS